MIVSVALYSISHTHTNTPTRPSQPRQSIHWQMVIHLINLLCLVVVKHDISISDIVWTTFFFSFFHIQFAVRIFFCDFSLIFKWSLDVCLGIYFERSPLFFSSSGCSVQPIVFLLLLSFCPLARPFLYTFTVIPPMSSREFDGWKMAANKPMLSYTISSSMLTFWNSVFEFKIKIQ